MAIEIIPKQKLKKITLANIILYLVLVVFLAFFVIYFILNHFFLKTDQELSDIEKNLIRTSEEKKLEDEIFDYQKKIKDFSLLLSDHRFPVNFFNFLEKINHPKIWLSNFTLDLKNGQATISGQTENFEILGQQILIFKKEVLIKDINLSRVSISKEGKVEFDFQLTFDPKIFK